MQVNHVETNSRSAYLRGFADGLAASHRKAALTAYLRVGIDDYALGYRSGFFARATSTHEAGSHDRLTQRTA